MPKCILSLPSTQAHAFKIGKLRMHVHKYKKNFYVDKGTGKDTYHSVKLVSETTKQQKL